ncbi:MAG: hypothetical protein IPO91_18935 [Chloroflexi bacterium]|nr:hypothetical protein [Chloroflexota bacterium]
MEICCAPRFKSSVHQLIAVNPYSPYSIFGKYKARKGLSRDETWAKFEDIWQNGLGHVVETAIATHDDLDSENARSFLSKEEAGYLDEHKERRSIEYRGSPFIVQFRRIQDTVVEIDQIWYAHAHDGERNLICVEFENAEEKERFNILARAEGHGSGQSLLEEYVRQLMEKHKP